MTLTDEPNNLTDAAIEEYLKLLDAGIEVEQQYFIETHSPDVADALRSFFGSLSLIRRVTEVNVSLDETITGTITRSEHLSQSSKSENSISADEQLFALLPVSFGRYRIEKLLGRGAMGAVYRAHDTHLDRPVAIKLPHFTDSSTPERRERLLQEARAAAILSHANICRIYDVGTLENMPFIAMELIDGHPLADEIHRDVTLPITSVVETVRKLALALQSAHESGIVHRDLKPMNVMLRPDGEPVLMDFGLAQRPVSSGEERLTKEGTLVGSAAYMSPEQVLADQAVIGPASDIWGLGVVFYELLTGSIPFKGTVLAILVKVVSEKVIPPNQLRPDIDSVLSDICCRMLAKKSEDRFKSMLEVADALKLWLKAESQNVAAAPLKSSTSDNVERQDHSISTNPGSIGIREILGCFCHPLKTVRRFRRQPKNQMSDERKNDTVKVHLQIVSLLHVALGIYTLFSAIVVAAVLNLTWIQIPNSHHAPVGMTNILLIICGCLLASSLMTIIGGCALYLGKPWGRPLILVLAMLELLHLPFGTVLGIYTLWVLLRDPQLETSNI